LGVLLPNHRAFELAEDGCGRRIDEASRAVPGRRLEHRNSSTRVNLAVRDRLSQGLYVADVRCQVEHGVHIAGGFRY
jgi:hypothetical protein